MSGFAGIQGEAAANNLRTLLGVERSWLTAAFDEIDLRYGSFDNYIRDGLGLSDRDIEQLRTTLLE